MSDQSALIDASLWRNIENILPWTSYGVNWLLLCLGTFSLGVSRSQYCLTLWDHMHEKMFWAQLQLELLPSGLFFLRQSFLKSGVEKLTPLWNPIETGPGQFLHSQLRAAIRTPRSTLPHLILQEFVSGIITLPITPNNFWRYNKHNSQAKMTPPWFVPLRKDYTIFDIKKLMESLDIMNITSVTLEILGEYLRTFWKVHSAQNEMFFLDRIWIWMSVCPWNKWDHRAGIYKPCPEHFLGNLALWSWCLVRHPQAPKSPRWLKIKNQSDWKVAQELTIWAEKSHFRHSAGQRVTFESLEGRAQKSLSKSLFESLWTFRVVGGGHQDYRSSCEPCTKS